MSSTGTYARKTVDIKTVHSNVDQQLIQITEDKLRLILNDHVKCMERKSEWVAPLGILLTIIVTFSTTDFKDIYFSADTWKAIFIMSGMLTCVWLIKSLYT